MLNFLLLYVKDIEFIIILLINWKTSNERDHYMCFLHYWLCFSSDSELLLHARAKNKKKNQWLETCRFPPLLQTIERDMAMYYKKEKLRWSASIIEKKRDRWTLLYHFSCHSFGGQGHALNFIAKENTLCTILIGFQHTF